MATLPPPVTVKTRLWSDEVRMAEGDEPPPRFEPVYEFSNGRKFEDRDPYSEPSPP